MKLKIQTIKLFPINMKNKFDLLVIYFVLYPIICIFKEYTQYYYFFFGFPVLIYIFFQIKKFKINKNISIVFLIIIVFSIYSLFNMYKSQYIYNWIGMMGILFIYSMPWLFWSSQIDEWRTFPQYLSKYNYSIFISAWLLFMHDLFQGVSMNGNMNVSYALMPSVIISMYSFLRWKSKTSAVICIIGLVSIILIGSRGPLLCIATFLLIYIFQNLKKYKYLILITCVGLIFLLFYIDQISSSFLLFLNEYGSDSRTISKLLDGTFLSTTGRDNISRVVFDTIKSFPIFGVGIGGERVIINSLIYGFTKNMGSCYPHNLFFEVIVQFGIPLSLIFILYFIVRSYNLIKNESEEKETILIIFSISIIHLLLSSSYLENPLFFCLLGIYLSNRKTRRTVKG